jgi:hypothetical protein
MPAQRVGKNAVAIGRFDVVGQDAAATPEFIGHIALARERATNYRVTEPLNVVHMRPPLEHAGQCHAHCIGSVGLTADEEQQIAVFSDEIQSEYLAAQVNTRSQYVISPHVKEVRSDDGTVVCYRFSCAGFVIEAYHEAGIDVLTFADEDLPPVSLDALKTQYPRFAGLLDSDRMREELGIPGDGPWRVVLAGYVMNALDRPESAIRSLRYSPQPGDEFFPRR